MATVPHLAPNLKHISATRRNRYTRRHIVGPSVPRSSPSSEIQRRTRNIHYQKRLSVTSAETGKRSVNYLASHRRSSALKKRIGRPDCTLISKLSKKDNRPRLCRQGHNIATRIFRTLAAKLRCTLLSCSSLRKLHTIQVHRLRPDLVLARSRFETEKRASCIPIAGYNPCSCGFLCGRRDT
jgi:hypothetical protein